MGMFDSVVHDCPCGVRVEWQSKAGPCSLLDYDPSAVPVAVAQDVKDETAVCPGCGAGYVLRAPFLTPAVYMVVESA